MDGYDQLSTTRDDLLKDLHLIDLARKLTTEGGDDESGGRAQEVLGKTLALVRIDADRYLNALEQFRVKNGLR